MRKYLLILFCLLSSNTALTAQAGRRGELCLFGGANQDVYLGCISCGENDAESIWNPTGIYGLISGATSIWNEHGIYGDETSIYSPFNSAALYPPAVKSGKIFYGYFTVDKFNRERIESELFLRIYDEYREIRKNPKAWYRNYRKSAPFS